MNGPSSFFRSLRTLALVLLATGLSFVGCNCDESTTKELRRLEIRPTALVFPLTPVGQEATLSIELKNPEKLDVQISKLDLSAATHPAFSIIEPPSLPLDLKPQATATLKIRFSPKSGGGASGRLQIWTDADNGDDKGKIDVSLLSVVNAPSPIFSCAPTLDFGSVRLQDKKTLDCILTNQGTADWIIEGVQLSEGAEREFSAQISLPKTIKPNSPGETIQITYSPQDLQDDQADLFLVAKADEKGEAMRSSVQMIGKVAKAAIQVVPEILIYPLTSQGKETSRKLTILSRGDIELKVTSLTIISGTDKPFSVDPSIVLPLTIQANQATEIPIIYKGGSLTRQQGSLNIESSDPDRPVVEVPLYAVTDGCDLQVSPRKLAFPSKKTVTVSLSNQGNRSCTIKKIQMDASSSKDYLMIPETWPLLSLAPNASLEFFVEYRPSDNVDDKGKIVIESDDADEPRIELTLEAPLRLESCQLSPNPASLNFGRIPIGKTSTRSFTFTNEGLKDCQITKVEVPAIPGQGAAFQIARPIATPTILKPGDRLPVEILFAPDRAVWYQGQLLLDSDDSANPAFKLQLLGSADQLCIRAVPDDLRFDDTQTTCSARPQTLAIYNLCPQPLTVKQIAMTGATSGEFGFGKLPTLPATLQIGEVVEVSLTYQPKDLTADQGTLRIANSSDALPDLEIPLQGVGVSSPQQTDTFTQSASPKADILFVIDDSFSMAKRQQSLSQNLSIFLQEAQTRQSDFQIAVTTTTIPKTAGASQRPGGCFVGTTDKILTPKTPNLLTVFQQRVKVGTSGDTVEQGLEAAYRALTPPLLLNPSCNLGFLRKEATLSVVFVTDEPDQSPQSVAFYQQFFEGLRGPLRDRSVRLSAITAPMPAKKCEDATTEGRYWGLALLFGGVTESICSQDWSATLRSLASSTFGLQRSFFLSRPATAASIQVKVNGQAQAPTAFSFDPKTNALTFQAASVPQPGQAIEISYTAVCLPQTP